MPLTDSAIRNAVIRSLANKEPHAPQEDSSKLAQEVIKGLMVAGVNL